MAGRVGPNCCPQHCGHCGTPHHFPPGFHDVHNVVGNNWDSAKAPTPRTPGWEMMWYSNVVGNNWDHGINSSPYHGGTEPSCEKLRGIPDPPIAKHLPYSNRTRAALAPREKNFWRAGPTDFVGNKYRTHRCLGQQLAEWVGAPPPARNPQNRIVAAGNNWGSIRCALTSIRITFVTPESRRTR